MCLFYSLYHFCHSLSIIVICYHSLSFVVTCCTTCCHSLSFIVICCHSLYQSLPFVIICYHSLSFVVTRCTTRCHSLSLVVPLVVIRCHSLSLNVPLVYLFINDVSTTDPAFAYLTYLFFFYLLAGPVKVHVKYQRRKLLQQQKAVNQDLFYPLPVPISKNCLFEKT